MTDREALRAALAPRPARTGEVVPLLKQRPDDPWTYADACEVVDRRSGGRCECPRACGLPATVHHHIAGRGGANPHHPDNLLHLAVECHQWIHSHPEESYANGTMRRRVR